jgi:hypothetical protein
LPRNVRPVVFPKQVALPFGFGLIGSIADPIMGVSLIQTVVGVVIGAHDDGSGRQVGGWDASPLFALCIYFCVVGVALEAGKALASCVTETDKKAMRWIEFGAAFAAWLVIGIGMAVLRANETALVNGTAMVDEGVAEGGHDWVVALLLLALHLISGVCVMSATYGYLTSSYHFVKPAQKKAAKAVADADKAGGLALHVVQALDTNRLAACQWANEYKTHCIRLANETARVKDSLRLALAAHLGSPGETGSVYEPHRPTNGPE